MGRSSEMVISRLRQQGANLGVLVLLLWGLESFDYFLRYSTDVRMDSWGIVPRTWGGLKGIFLAPLLHVDFNHLAANTIPLLVLAWLVLLEGVGRFWRATLIIALVSGLAVWCFGKGDNIYIGASGLVFGYFGFVLMRAWVSRRPMWIAVAIGCAVVYGGLIFSLLQVVQGISWLGHLSGMIAGMLAAEWLHTDQRSALLTSIRAK